MGPGGIRGPRHLAVANDLLRVLAPEPCCDGHGSLTRVVAELIIPNNTKKNMAPRAFIEPLLITKSNQVKSAVVDNIYTDDNMRG